MLANLVDELVILGLKEIKMEHNPPIKQLLFLGPHPPYLS